MIWKKITVKGYDKKPIKYVCERMLGTLVIYANREENLFDLIIFVKTGEYVCHITDTIAGNGTLEQAKRMLISNYVGIMAKEIKLVSGERIPGGGVF